MDDLTAVEEKPYQFSVTFDKGKKTENIKYYEVNISLALLITFVEITKKGNRGIETIIETLTD